MADPIITPMSPAERQNALETNLDRDHADAWTQMFNDPASATDPRKQINLAQMMGMNVGAGHFIVNNGAQQAAQGTTVAAASPQGPVTTAPPAPNTVPPKFNNVADPNRTTIGDDYVLERRGQTTITGADVRATLDDPNKSQAQKDMVLKRYGLALADAPAGGGPRALTLPASQVAQPAAAAAAPATPGSPAAAVAPSGAPVSATSWGTRNSPGATAAATTTAGATGLLALGNTAVRSGGIFSLGSMGAFSAAGSALSAVGMSGPAFTMSKVVRSISSSYQDSSFIGMLHSNMNIESLLYYWMSYASDKYDKKLREKMEEWTLQSQLEDQQQTNSSIANSVGSVVGLLTGTGSMATNIANGVATTANNYLAATQGTGKSSTVLAQEVQILIQQWKTITDMTSNLSKDINDMAMTAVRNLR